MKILRNIVIIAIPILIFINIYRFMFYNSSYDYRGFSYMRDYFSTFPGISTTINLIKTMQETATKFNSIEITSVLDIFGVVSNFFTMVGLAFSLPIGFIVDILRNIWWFIQIFYGSPSV